MLLVYAFLSRYTHNNYHVEKSTVVQSEVLSTEQMKEIDSGNDFDGSWWCVFCWIDYSYAEG
jgi:hypothetical protein